MAFNFSFLLLRKQVPQLKNPVFASSGWFLQGMSFQAQIFLRARQSDALHRIEITFKFEKYENEQDTGNNLAIM